jgi:aryl-alcohol dehydrogenase-like predicted oxidoreductase
MQWGWTADEAQSYEIMDAYGEAGGNFLDTANVYTGWVEGGRVGHSEEIIGRWMQERGNRNEIVLATKVRGRMWDGPNGEGLSRYHIIRACEDSLRRLQTDYIDLYQTHRTDPDTPIDETMAALDTLVQQGKVRYLGCSNYGPGALTESLWASDKHNLARYDSIQPHYNLISRVDYEKETRGICARYGIGVIPYSPLAAGFLTGKYSRDQKIDTTRAGNINARYATDKGWAALDAVKAVAQENGSTPTAVSLQWLLAQPEMSSPIIGANSVAQLHDSLTALDGSLSKEQVDRISATTAWE